MAQIDNQLRLVLVVGISLLLICSGEKHTKEDSSKQPEEETPTSPTPSQDVPSDARKPPPAEEGMMPMNLDVRIHRE